MQCTIVKSITKTFFIEYKVNLLYKQYTLLPKLGIAFTKTYKNAAKMLKKCQQHKCYIYQNVTKMLLKCYHFVKNAKSLLYQNIFEYAKMLLASPYMPCYITTCYHLVLVYLIDKKRKIVHWQHFCIFYKNALSIL